MRRPAVHGNRAGSPNYAENGGVPFQDIEKLRRWPFDVYVTTSLVNKVPCALVFAGSESRTVLFGKNWIADAAQFGVHGLIPNVVVPVAADFVQLVHRVAVSSVLPSAQEMTSVVGLTSALSWQLRTPTVADARAVAAATEGPIDATLASAHATAIGSRSFLARPLDRSRPVRPVRWWACPRGATWVMHPLARFAATELWCPQPPTPTHQMRDRRAPMERR